MSLQNNEKSTQCHYLLPLKEAVVVVDMVVAVVVVVVEIPKAIYMKHYGYYYFYLSHY